MNIVLWLLAIGLLFIYDYRDNSKMYVGSLAGQSIIPYSIRQNKLYQFVLLVIGIGIISFIYNYLNRSNTDREEPEYYSQFRH